VVLRHESVDWGAFGTEPLLNFLSCDSEWAAPSTVQSWMCMSLFISLLV